MKRTQRIASSESDTRGMQAMKQRMSRIAKAATFVALIMALAFGGAAPSVALAETESGKGTGTITVNVADDNNSGMYYVYKIFTCDVDKIEWTNDYEATNVEWPSGDMKTKVLTAIQTYDKTTKALDNKWTAQDAANYIESMIANSANNIVGANGFAENLAKAVDESYPSATLEAGTTASLDEGYYMIVAMPYGYYGSALDYDESPVGTSPVFTMLGNGQDLTVYDKASVPTLRKTVAEGSDSTPATCADAQVGQEVTFTLTGTMPKNIVTFTKYTYRFKDQLPKGLDFVDDSVTVKVTIGDTTYNVDPTSYVCSYDKKYRDLEVDFKDGSNDNNLLAATGVAEGGTISATLPIDATAEVSMSYRAKLNPSAGVGATGNQNKAYLNYGNDPQNPTYYGRSADAKATLYEYQLQLTKCSTDANTKLPGAQFTIQATDPDDTGSKDKYVKIDGTLGNTTLPETTDEDYTNYVFTTDSDGLITVTGLDAGTYTITEIAAPTIDQNAYMILTTPLKLTITPTFDSNGLLEKMSAKLSGGNGDENTRVTSAENDKSGIITIQVTNALPTERLPLTGLPGITLVFVAGGTILVASLAVIVRRHMKGEH